MGWLLASATMGTTAFYPTAQSLGPANLHSQEHTWACRVGWLHGGLHFSQSCSHVSMRGGCHVKFIFIAQVSWTWAAL